MATDPLADAVPPRLSSWVTLALRAWRAYVFTSGVVRAVRLGAAGLKAGVTLGRALVTEQTAVMVRQGGSGEGCAGLVEALDLMAVGLKASVTLGGALFAEQTAVMVRTDAWREAVWRGVDGAGALSPRAACMQGSISAGGMVGCTLASRHLQGGDWHPRPAGQCPSPVFLAALSGPAAAHPSEAGWHAFDHFVRSVTPAHTLNNTRARNPVLQVQFLSTLLTSAAGPAAIHPGRVSYWEGEFHAPTDTPFPPTCVS